MSIPIDAEKLARYSMFESMAERMVDQAAAVTNAPEEAIALFCSCLEIIAVRHELVDHPDLRDAYARAVDAALRVGLNGRARR